MLKKLLGRKKKLDVVRQGDVFIIPLAKLPGDIKGARPVLAEGEVTGHAHRLADPSAAQVFSGKSGLFLQVVADSVDVVHEEHRTVKIPRGAYEIRIQREYHPKEIRRVVD